MQLRTTVVGMTLVALSVSSVLAGCTSTSPSATPGPSSGSTPARSGSPSSPAPQQSDSPTSTPTPTPSPSPTASSADVAAGPGRCETRHLALSEGGMEGAAGSTYVTYHLKNVGPARCSLSGYPGFSLLRADGSVIQHPATRNTMPHKTVELSPGQQAEFVVRSLDPSNPDNGCSSDWRTAQVQVYPPDETTAIRQHSDVPACDLTVGPVTAG